MNKTLVAYFSVSGTTAGVARRLAAVTGADLYEIKPRQKYTAADLDWTDPSSRSTVEMKNLSARPEIQSTFDLSNYQVIFVGFPIWWYLAPTIVNSFLESGDLRGKTVVPFATSGGSGLGRTVAHLSGSCPGARLLTGKRLAADISVEELKEWVKSLEI